MSEIRRVIMSRNLTRWYIGRVFIDRDNYDRSQKYSIWLPGASEMGFAKQVGFANTLREALEYARGFHR